ncbi:MAG: hypothetical protein RR253_05170 [Oscillospiraceae bacterium]
MFSQTIALIIISLVMFVLFARKTSFKYGLGVLPIAIVPITYLAAFPLSNLIGNIAVNTPTFIIRILISVVALTLACGFIAVAAYSIPVKKIRILYTAMLTIYCVVLTMIYIRSIVLVALAI